MNQAIDKGVEHNLEYRVCWDDGSIHHLASRGRTVFNSEGKAIRMTGVVLDIKERKLAEARQLQLLQAQTAREEAETANRIKDQFLAVLSHELRSPLNPILGWSSLLRKGKLDTTKTAHALEIIERNAKLQVQLIDDLLDISRFLRGKLTLTVAPVDLSTIISAALETVRLAVEAKSLQIQTVISPAVGSVNGDAGRSQQVVWNLLSNAVKFTPVGGRISIELSSVGTNAQIQVKDNGKGIYPDFLPYVFEHFRQEDGATTPKFGGLGLGLAIARQIVELHGGRIWVESGGENQEATFTVELPLVHTANPVEEVADTNLSQSDDLPLANLRVLVVSVISECQKWMVMRSCVRFARFHWIKAGKFQRSRSLLMPEKLTSNRHSSAGFQQHVAKPVDPETLVSAISALCNNSPPDSIL